MSLARIHRNCVLLAVTGVILTAWALSGCATNTAPSDGTAATSRPAVATIGHAELWSQTCNRCHNALSPDQYSPAQWQMIMMHMRQRASLTAEEYNEILQFLQASH
jgi:cytochrome c5